MLSAAFANHLTIAGNIIPVKMTKILSFQLNVIQKSKVDETI